MTELNSAATLEDAIRRARQAMSERDWLAAAGWWKSAMGLAPELAATHLGAGNALSHAGRADEAEAVLSRATASFPDHEQLAVSWARAAQLRRDWTAALERWQVVESRFSPSIASSLGRIDALQGARAAIGAEGLASAERALSEAQARGEDTPNARRLTFEIAVIRGDLAGAEEAAHRVSEVAPTAGPFVRLAQAFWAAHDPESAARTAEAALAKDQDSTPALVVLAMSATELGQGERALASYGRLIDLAPDVARWRLKRVDLLSWLGRLDEAAEELKAVRERWPDNPGVRIAFRTFHAGTELFLDESDSDRSRSYESLPQFERQLQSIARRVPRDSQWTRAPVEPILGRDVLVSARVDSNTVVLIFTGFNDSLSIPIMLFDRFLATHGATVVYLKDLRRLRYLRGIQSLADDYAGTLEALRDIVARLGAKRLVTLGNCVGGAAAIRYGVELGAERAIAFEPLTDLGQDTDDGIEKGLNFQRRRLSAAGLTEMADLRLFLRDRAHQTEILVHHRAQDEWRLQDTRRLENLLGVTLFGHSTGSYVHVVRHLAATSPDFSQFLASQIDPGADSVAIQRQTNI